MAKKDDSLDDIGAPAGYSSNTSFTGGQSDSKTSVEGLSWDDSKASSYVEKAGAPKYQPVDYAKGTASSAHLSRNKPDKVMAISGGHAARSA